MESTIKIIQKSIHAFLKHYDYFTTISIISLPFSISLLLSTTFLANTYSHSIHSRLHFLFDAAGFPPESEFYYILNLKLVQTINSSILVLPFTLSFLLITKAFIIQFLNTNYKNAPSFIGIFMSVLQTQIWSTLVIISANATCFWVLFIAFHFLETLHFPSLLFAITGGIGYSIVIANALIICNLALVLSGMESSGGVISILKACVMLRGRTSTALGLSLSFNMALAGIEALFHFRVIKNYYDSDVDRPTSTMVLEGLFIAYLHSILITLDTIIGCVFFKSCKIVYDQNIVGNGTGLINEDGDERNGLVLV